MRILIAENDLVSRKLLETVLNKWGYAVTVVSSGTEALDVLRGPDPPRLAIIDLVIPGMDGVEVCRNVRKNVVDPYIYILLLSGKTSKDDLIEGLKAGADDYLAKPFSANELEVRLIAGKRVLELQSELTLARAALHDKATRDPLTGLPNRLLFGDRLVQNLAQARRRGEKLAIMFMDLNGFKYVNDTMGHSNGDLLLQQVADRLTSILRDVDTIARMGGDEFTLIQNGLDSVEDAVTVSSKVLSIFNSPFEIDGQEIFMSASIGVSIYPDDGSDAETIVRNADMALHQAKAHGRNTVHLYTSALDDEANRRITIESSLRRSVERGEFVLYYQPKLSIVTGKIVGAEALLRWVHPELGVVMPDQFIPIAEESGLINPIGEWVLHQACRQNKEWQEKGYPAMEIAVNVSARQLRSNDFKAMVERVLQEMSLDPSCLGIELTESTLMQNPDKTIGILRHLKAMGIRIAIDDFGTGYSSLSYLKKLPIDAVKIDKSFVRDVTLDQDDSAIARAVVAMAHSMKLSVVAEGVENLEQLAFLKIIGCDEMQGYFISKPVPSGEFEELLNNIDLGNWSNHQAA